MRKPQFREEFEHVKAMVDKLTFSGTIIEGKLPLFISKQIGMALKGFEGKIVKITVERQKKRRSQSQNSFYWAVVIPCVMQVLEAYGNVPDTEMAHELCKEQFLPSSGIQYVKVRGMSLMEFRTSAELSTIEWEQYMDSIRAWCAGEGVQVPLPNEQRTWRRRLKCSRLMVTR